MVTMDRGQAHALEAFVAATVLLASVTFALQVTAVTPLTASTSSQHIENQQAAVAQGLLDAAAENGSLKRTLLLENISAEEGGNYVAGGPPTVFGRMLNDTFRDRGIAFNVIVYSVQSNQEGKALNRVSLVHMGQPSDHAASASRLVTLMDDDVLHEVDDRTAIPTTTRLDSASSFYVDQRHDTDPVWSALKVEVVVWRM
ncbi:hypothetical protein GJR96_14665 [Haloferax sp. MBLA0076]|uniref:Uncharacterized protein n=1 Tax=Haloferax litoreum TaxID=2666140 RepID=A0A6A8GIJ8_9EURY|nr:MULTISPECIES: hypothetical protein [Haloferax]KAB1194617.1 hypothetical protein Hfx1148_14595 [Haloferax sp. CBA1148]MRX23194.1 hypothetical protein [Haloferax litoreum]